MWGGGQKIIIKIIITMNEIKNQNTTPEEVLEEQQQDAAAAGWRNATSFLPVVRPGGRRVGPATYSIIAAVLEPSAGQALYHPGVQTKSEEGSGG